MEEIGYDLSTHRSKGFTEVPFFQVFDAVVLLGCGDQCPFVMSARVEEWNIPDPRNLPLNQFREVRNLIESRVKELLALLGLKGSAA